MQSLTPEVAASHRHPDGLFSRLRAALESMIAPTLEERQFGNLPCRSDSVWPPINDETRQEGGFRRSRDVAGPRGSKPRPAIAAGACQELQHAGDSFRARRSDL
jgi:hypothetical protein